MNAVIAALLLACSGRVIPRATLIYQKDMPNILLAQELYGIVFKQRDKKSDKYLTCPAVQERSGDSAPLMDCFDRSYRKYLSP
jgi:hypothetical protein